MATTSNSAPTNPFIGKEVFDEEVRRIRDLNEKLIQAAKEAGQVSIDTYEKALQSLLDFQEKAAKSSQLEWVTAVAEMHAKFVQSVSSSYVNAAREVLK